MIGNVSRWDERKIFMDRVRVIDVRESVLADNDRKAQETRDKLKKQGTYFLNVMSSPGSGKTTTLKRLITDMTSDFSFGVMEADIDGDVDALAMQKNGVKTIQLHTGGMCHLDAEMAAQGMSCLGTYGLDCVVLENIGNLVCPAEFDTGASASIEILSVPEGDDKPLKYPLMFQVCKAMVINKIDVLPYFDFDMDRVRSYALSRNPDLQIFPVSAKTGEGFDALESWLSGQIRAWKESKDLSPELRHRL